MSLGTPYGTYPHLSDSSFSLTWATAGPLLDGPFNALTDTTLRLKFDEIALDSDFLGDGPSIVEELSQLASSRGIRLKQQRGGSVGQVFWRAPCGEFTSL